MEEERTSQPRCERALCFKVSRRLVSILYLNITGPSRCDGSMRCVITDRVYVIVEGDDDGLFVISDAILSCLPVRSALSGLVITKTSGLQ